MRIHELRNEVDDKMITLTPEQLVTVGKKLQVRATRLSGSHLSVLRAVSESVEKHCGESNETALNVLSSVVTDLNELLGITVDPPEREGVQEEDAGTEEVGLDAQKKDEGADSTDEDDDEDTRQKELDVDMVVATVDKVDNEPEDSDGDERGDGKKKSENEESSSSGESEDDDKETKQEKIEGYFTPEEDGDEHGIDQEKKNKGSEIERLEKLVEELKAQRQLDNEEAHMLKMKIGEVEDEKNKIREEKEHQEIENEKRRKIEAEKMQKMNEERKQLEMEELKRRERKEEKRKEKKSRAEIKDKRSPDSEKDQQLKINVKKNGNEMPEKKDKKSRKELEEVVTKEVKTTVNVIASKNLNANKDQVVQKRSTNKEKEIRSKKAVNSSDEGCSSTQKRKKIETKSGKRLLKEKVTPNAVSSSESSEEEVQVRASVRSRTVATSSGDEAGEKLRKKLKKISFKDKSRRKDKRSCSTDIVLSDDEEASAKKNSKKSSVSKKNKLRHKLSSDDEDSSDKENVPTKRKSKSRSKNKKDQRLSTSEDDEESSNDGNAAFKRKSKKQTQKKDKRKPSSESSSEEQQYPKRKSKVKAEQSSSEEEQTRKKSSSLRHDDLKSLKACWRPPLKFKGQIGGSGKEKLEFVGLQKQVSRARDRDPPYDEREIIDAVINTVTAGSKLRKFLDNSPDMSLDELMAELKSILDDADGKVLLKQLQNLKQDPNDDAQQFVLDAYYYKKQLVAKKILSEEMAQEILLETLETGFRSESVRNSMRPFLRDQSITERKILEEVKHAMKVEGDTNSKFDKKTARVNELETHSKDYMLQQQQMLLQKQSDELAETKATVAELKFRVENNKNNTPSDNPTLNSNNMNNVNTTPPCNCKQRQKKVEWACDNCIASGAKTRCTHCFKCGEGDHKAQECPKKSSNPTRSVPRDDGH